LLLPLVAGAALTVFAGSAWGVGLGIGLLVAFVAGGFVLLAGDMVENASG
jgi:hypothetical protein